MKQAKYLCSKISNHEWAGALVYSFTGNWQDETLEINLLEIYPLQHAHGMNFEGSYTFDYNYVIDKGYDVTQIRLGLIHSHSNMGVFFSEPDTQELKENSEVYPFYLSAITNNRNEWTAKICIYGEDEFVKTGTKKIKLVDGKFAEAPYSIAQVVKTYKILDCNCATTVDSFEDELFLEQVEKIIQNKVEPKVVTYEDIWAKLISGKYTLFEAVEEFFEGEDYTWQELAVACPCYDSSEFSPELLLSYIRKMYRQFDKVPNAHIVTVGINLFKGFNTNFVKELRKDYEEYIRKLK